MNLHPQQEPEEPGGAQVELSDPAGLLSPQDRAWLRQTAAAAVQRLGATGEVRARIVGDAEMSAAHERYAGAQGTTDVLTFDLRDQPRPDHPLDVDILVCYDEAARQAARRGHEPARELLLYIVHGVLHCLGHDDHTEDGYARMHAEEDRLLAALGIGPVFAPDGGGRS